MNRAVARTFAKNEKKESSIRDSLGRFIFSLVRQHGGEVEEGGHGTAGPVAGVRRHSVDVQGKTAERNLNISAVRRSLLDSLLRKVSNHQAVTLRRKAFDQLTINGNSAPFLALVGVSLGRLSCPADIL